MSIRDDINAQIGAERLFELHPYLESISVERGVLMSQPVKELVLGPWINDALEERGNLLRADLDDFISGERIIVCIEPYKAGCAHMGILHPITDGVWDYRSRDPKPQLRVFGQFAEKDVFVALNWEYRQNLKGQASNRWRAELNTCKNAWRNLFPAYRALRGDQIDDYFQSDIVDVRDI